MSILVFASTTRRYYSPAHTSSATPTRLRLQQMQIDLCPESTDDLHPSDSQRGDSAELFSSADANFTHRPSTKVVQ
jgi:hypothetical protein